MLDLNTLLAERYRIGYMLEEQPGCTLYRAHPLEQPDTTVLVAACQQPDDATLHHTLQIAAALHNVVAAALLPLHETFAEDQTIYMVMADPAGTDLSRTTREQLPGFTADGNADIQRTEPLLQLFELLHSHTPPLLVGELQPTDVWVSPDGTPYLAPVALIRPLATMPTPYRAPELEQPASTPTPTSDLYALGAVLYHLLTGWAPTSATQREVGTALARPTSLNPALTPLTNNVLERALALQPHQRYSRAVELLRALQIARLIGMQDVPVASMPVVQPTPARETVRFADVAEQAPPQAATPLPVTPHAAPAIETAASIVPAPADNTCLVIFIGLLLLLGALFCALIGFFFFGPGLDLLG